MAKKAKAMIAPATSTQSKPRKYVHQTTKSVAKGTYPSLDWYYRNRTKVLKKAKARRKLFNDVLKLVAEYKRY